MTAEIETMIQALSDKWNVAIRSPWNTETENLQDWELRLIPRESHWGNYPKFSGKTLREVVTAALTGNESSSGAAK